MTRPALATCLLLALALGLAAPAARAQTPLTADTIQAVNLGPEQAAAIRQYPTEPLARLASDQPRDIRAARDRLLEPLRDPRASVVFRQAYADALVPQLAAITKDPRDLNAVNALRILGEVGTPSALDALEAALADQRLPVRYAAVMGMERTLLAIRSVSPAVGADRLSRVLARLGRVVAQDQSPEVVQAAVRALASVLTLEREGFTVLRPASLRAMAEATRARIPQLSGADAVAFYPAMLALCQVTRDALLQNNPALALDAEAARHAAEVNGHCFAYVFRAVRAGQFRDDPAAREAAASIVATAETALLVAARRAARPIGLVEPLRAANDRAFNDRALEMLQLLKDPPLSFPADHFIK